MNRRDLLLTEMNIPQWILVKWISLEQAMRLQFDHQPIFWLIQAEQQAVRFAKKFANQTAWQCESWQALCYAQQKRQLWQQMQSFCPQFEETL